MTTRITSIFVMLILISFFTFIFIESFYEDRYRNTCIDAGGIAIDLHNHLTCIDPNSIKKLTVP
jgi:hypothetical protein